MVTVKNWPVRIAEVGRVVTADQLARHVFRDCKHPADTARQAIRRAETQGKTTTEWAVLHPVIDVSEPVIDWSPHEPRPTFDRAAWTLKSRWSRQPTRTKVVYPTIAMRRPRPSELLHDIHLTEVFFKIGDSRHWKHEDRFRGQWNLGVIPDALIENKNGSQIAIDFGGRYEATKLASMHNEYEKAGQSYRVY